jgi:hypothetical protein
VNTGDTVHGTGAVSRACVSDRSGRRTLEIRQRSARVAVLQEMLDRMPSNRRARLLLIDPAIRAVDVGNGVPTVPQLNASAPAHTVMPAAIGSCAVITPISSAQNGPRF